MSERELFMQAYTNLRSEDSIPFPDAVFDEFIRLRQGYKLVPTTPTTKVYDKLFAEHDLDEDRVTYIYKDIMDAVGN